MLSRIFCFLSLLFLIVSCKTTDNEHQEKTSNQLINESSPYLLQHAYNPVNWYPWGEEALQKAKDENKMIIISVGYSACHWCHVMEHESFEDTTVARIMNEHFVAIKVDREERPDVDDVYMTACQLSSQRGCGWPLNAFALPDGRPVWAGTYFPKDQWLTILKRFKTDYEDDRKTLENRAYQMTNSLANTGDYYTPQTETGFEQTELDQMASNLANSIDLQYGGRTGAPKFPMPNNYLFLMDYNFSNPNEKIANPLWVTLDNLAQGGIYDHLGGGFARYSTDAKWLVPHFEKMLYDNGQLVQLFANAYANTKKEDYKRVVVETLAFIERELTSPKGGFYSSLDADSDGEEGKFYVWRQAEIDSLLTEQEGQLLSAFYNTHKRGNWEEQKNILHVTDSFASVCEDQNITLDEGEELLKTAKAKLFDARSSRIRPGLDDKILTAWNALMLQGYIRAYAVLGDPHYLEVALKNAHFLEKNMLQGDGRLNRNYKDGKSSINAFLDDYALLAQAYLQLYEVTFDTKWLQLSQKITDYALVHFKNPLSPLFYYTSDVDPPLVVRKMEVEDNVIASANSSFAEVLFLLSTYLYEPSYMKHSQNMLAVVRPLMVKENAAAFYANWAQVYLYFLRPPYEVAILGDDYETIRAGLQQNYLPNAIFLGGEKEGDLQLLQNKAVEDETFIYVCQNKVCKLPVQTVEAALPLIK